MDNLTAGNPVAHRVRVYYEASTIIKEGQPVAYNYDTTVNWFGGSVADDGTITASTTTAEGSQNIGKYVRVEDITADNAEFFAGVVTRGGWVGKAGPRVVDIYVPNGAIVPIWTDKDITIKDRLYLEHGQITLVNATQVGMGLCVGIANETVNRSGGAGICLAKLTGASESSVHGGTLGVGLSESLWEDCPIEEIERNPGLGIVYFDDFMQAPNLVTTEGWAIDQIPDAGTLVEIADEGGALQLSTINTTTVDEGVSAQLLNCRFKPVAASTIWFEARVQVNDVTDQWFIGLCATDTTIFSGGSIDNNTDRVGFYHAVDSSDNKVSVISERGSAATTSVDEDDFADGVYKTFGFRQTGITKAEFYVNGVLVKTISTTTNIPNAAMCLSLATLMEVTGALVSMKVDWVKCVQLGARA